MRALVLGLSLLLVAPGAMAAQTASSNQQASAEMTRLHDALRLNSSQEGAWRDYLAAIAPSPQTDARRRSAEELMPTLPTPRRVALMQSTMAADASDLQREGAAVVTFYNQLTPAQQQIFDKETLPGKSSSPTVD
jgi:hypothetical protein